MNQVQMQKIGQDVYRVVYANRRFVVYHARQVIRRTGRSRHFVKFLEGFINNGLTRFAISLGVPTPAELRDFLARLGHAWSGLQAALERMGEALGVAGGLAFCDGFDQRVRPLMVPVMA